MKKILFLVAIFAFASFATFAQKMSEKNGIQCVDRGELTNVRAAADWGTFTNFTATDMNGVSHNIQNYLDEGKYVVVDFFATWCGPCWQLHQAGYLETLYNSCGQGGTQEFVILMVECDASTNDAAVQGTGSQGDFTNGGTNPVPICNPTTEYAGYVSLYEGYVPSIYLFCPSGYVVDAYNYIGSEANIRSLAATCPMADGAPIVDINAPEVIQMGQGANFTSSVVSVANVLSYSWTFEGANPATATTANVNNVVWDAVGTYTVTLEIANENGTATATKIVNVADCSAGITEFPFEEGFENGIGCWTYSSANTANAADMGIYQYADGDYYGFVFSSYAQATDYKQYLISPLLNHNGVLDMTYGVAAPYGSYGSAESFKVMYSTTTPTVSALVDIAGSASTTTYGSIPFDTKSCQIPADAKYVAIVYTSNYAYYLYVDDIRIEANNETTGIENSVNNSIALYPNPTTGILNITAEDVNSVEVYDITGRVVMMRGAENTIDMSELEAGVYFVNVATANGSAVQRVVKE